ncbi:ABC transporter permease [Pedobacter deserti]|uniref:ABC transporter permease n=1 Tax=Pedobacter deserti TaxID=2817382 RepID=UPI002108C497|nr:ABC transporter permease [Pedobacter sp. SYSU D00382]
MDNPYRKIWRRLRRNVPAVCGLAFIAMLLVVCLLGYLIIPDQTPNANDMQLQLSNQKPGRTFDFLIIGHGGTPEKRGLFDRMFFGQPSAIKRIPITSYREAGGYVYAREFIGDDEQSAEGKYPKIIGQNRYRQTFWLGTDMYGRDMLSRMVLGARVSLSVGLISVVISLIIGVSLGAAAGYFGGRVDRVISWFMNVVWSLPSLLLVIAISFSLGKGYWQIFIAVGLSTWVDVARLVRGQVMAMKEAEFVEAARALGFSADRIIIRHILPNIAGSIMVVASANFASAILLETGLSFLGFGAQPPVPSWGSMIREHYGYIIMDGAYLALLPGLAIMLTVYAFNVLAIGLRDAFDVKTQNISV